jgi:hypothetical protein
MDGNTADFEGDDSQPLAPAGSAISRTSTAMSRDPDDYIKAHRELVDARPAQRTPSNARRKSISISISRPEAFRSTTVSSTALSDAGSEKIVRPEKISLFRRVKSMFSFKSDTSDIGERGRETNQSLGSKIRSRSKSVAKMFSGKSEFQQR